MAYAVAIGAGYSRVIVRFATPQEALAKAIDEVAHDAQDVTIIVSATGEAFTPNGFAETVWKTSAADKERSVDDLLARAEEAVRRRTARDPRN